MKTVNWSDHELSILRFLMAEDPSGAALTSADARLKILARIERVLKKASRLDDAEFDKLKSELVR
jgi:hypothetical protein